MSKFYEITDTTGEVLATAPMPAAIIVAKALADALGKPTGIPASMMGGHKTPAEWAATIDGFRKLLAPA